MDRFKAQELNKIAKFSYHGYFLMVGCTVKFKEGWAKAFVEAERPIPESWREAFYDELFSDDESYRTSLEESVRWFGVRWAKS